MFLKDKGDALFKRGDVLGAIAAYTRALQIEPDYLEAAMNRCLCSLEAGQLEEAEEEAGELSGKLQRKMQNMGEELDASEVAAIKKQLGKLLMRKAVARARQSKLGERWVSWGTRVAASGYSGLR